MPRCKTRFLAIFLCLLGIFGCLQLRAQSGQFILDGDVADWQGIPAQTYAEPENASEPVALKKLAATHDEDYLYLKLRLDKSLQMVGANEHGARFYLYLDTDNDAETGYKTGSMGAELGFNLTNRIAYRNVAPEGQFKLDQAGIRVLPSVTGQTYELAVSRKHPEHRASLMNGDSVQVLFHEASGGAYLPDTGQAFHYAFEQAGLPAPAPISTEKENPDQLRLMAFNVLNNGLTQTGQKPHIQSLIRATKPDLLALNECWDISAPKAEDFMSNALPGKEWHAVKQDEGNITLSRFPVKDHWQVMPEARLTASLINLPNGPYSKDLLLVNAHLPCCDDDEGRQSQADALISFIQDAKTPGGKLTLPEETPVMVAGDMNLIGKAQTLETLKAGDIVNTGNYGEGGKPDWDGTNFRSATCRHTHARMNYTWLDTASRWPAGKLDYIFFANSVLKAHKSFALNTRTMPRHALNALDLERETSARASDHLPIVADFSLKSPVSRRAPQASEKVRIRTNARGTELVLHFPDSNSRPDTVSLYDLNGRRIGQCAADPGKAGAQARFNTSGIPKGIYWLQYQLESENRVKKVLILE